MNPFIDAVFLIAFGGIGFAPIPLLTTATVIKILNTGSGSAPSTHYYKIDILQIS
ncbi:TPA: hypothetical protein ROY17_005781 [Bacillus thuringiensis]|nr:hypothetical protein [Bacillus thuringiensis]